MRRAREAGGGSAARWLPGRVRGVARALRAHPFRVACALCVLAAGGYAAAEPGWTSRQLALSFGPRPTSYSELFFGNISGLPVHVRAGVDRAVPFVIVNREGRTIRYSYVVSLNGPGGQVLAEHGHVWLKDNAKADLLARFRPQVTDAPYTVTIKIGKPFDVIQFHGRTT